MCTTSPIGASSSESYRNVDTANVSMSATAGEARKYQNVALVDDATSADLNVLSNAALQLQQDIEMNETAAVVLNNAMDDTVEVTNVKNGKDDSIYKFHVFS